MLNTAGLSLEQAPPIGVPFRFFLTAPLFACVAGLILTWQGETVTIARWTPGALTVAHLLALGFLTQVMCGALFQMLPVLAGTPVPAALATARWTHGLLVIGTCALAYGFFGGGAMWLAGGAALVAVALALFLTATGSALARSASGSHTVTAMRLALVGLAVTVGLGLVLVAALLGWVHLDDFTAWANLHPAWGLLGWAGVLIIGVGYQVVPMFHVTPSYPRRLTAWSAPLGVAGLVTAGVLTGVDQPALADVGIGLAIAAFIMFGLVTLDRQRRRQRRRVDATLLHWWSALTAALAAAILWLVNGPAVLVGVLALVGVGVGLPSGMLFKIAPFLCWFHLQYRQLAAQRFDHRIPTMHGFLPERAARLHVLLHLAGLALLIAGVTFAPALVRVGGLVLALSSALLAWLLAHAARLYRHHAAALTCDGGPPDNGASPSQERAGIL